MIINLCLTLIKTLLTLFLAPIRVISFPAAVANIFAQIILLLAEGADFLSAFMHTAYIGSLLAFVISVSAFMNAYRFIKWVLRKIPFINIE